MKLSSCKLPHKALADVTLTPVETRSRTKMFRVDVGQFQAGFVEKLAARAGETHPWKAFRRAPGTHAPARYVTAFYEAEGGLQAAVACVLDRTLPS